MVRLTERSSDRLDCALSADARSEAKVGIDGKLLPVLAFCCVEVQVLHCVIIFIETGVAATIQRPTFLPILI